MAAFRRLFALAYVCLASLGAAQVSDQVAAARVLGPHWRQLSRSAGMVFSGTVLAVETQPAGRDLPLPLITTKFRVDRAIAGVHPGQMLTVREWAGAWAAHRAMREGQRLLIFLYPPSRLGLSSPVGGALGQVVLDAHGEIVPTSAAEAGDSGARLQSCPPENLGVFSQGECLPENSVVPPGLESFLRLSPALKRWALVKRPSGAGFSDGSLPSIASIQVLAPALEGWGNVERPSGAGFSDGSLPSIAQQKVVYNRQQFLSNQQQLHNKRQQFLSNQQHLHNNRQQFLYNQQPVLYNRDQVLYNLKCCANPSPPVAGNGRVAAAAIVTLRKVERAIRAARENFRSQREE